MTFIVTFIALLIERFFDWSHLRQWRWYVAYQRLMMQQFSKYSPYFVLVLTIVPILILVVLIEYFIGDWLYGFAKLLFELLVVLYCLGPQNLWADAFSCINALVQGDQQFAQEKLTRSFGITKSYSQSLHRHFLNDIFIEANRRVFSIVFWYVILGPLGAVLYRTVILSFSQAANEEIPPSFSQSARMVESVLDWVPVRLFTFIFALGGHFVQVLSYWRRKVLFGLSGNEMLLTECGAAALNNDDQERLAEDGSLEKAAVGLLDRSFVIMLVVVGIVTWVN